MKYRMIAADIDGTLLNPRRELEKETIEAAQKCMAQGAYFVLSSGRMPPALKDIAQRLHVNAPAVCYNGGAVVDLMNNKTLYSTPVPLELARDDATSRNTRIGAMAFNAPTKSSPGTPIHAAFGAVKPRRIPMTRPIRMRRIRLMEFHFLIMLMRIPPSFN